MLNITVGLVYTIISILCLHIINNIIYNKNINYWIKKKKYKIITRKLLLKLKLDIFYLYINIKSLNFNYKMYNKFEDEINP